MKFLKNMKKAKKDNKGFSLVELIIVIAIMAILVGIVGTQVIPYLNKSKEAKDFQIVNSYSTAAMTAYASYAEEVTATTSFSVYGSNSGTEEKLAKQIQGLTYDAVPTSSFKSTNGEKIKNIKITITIPTSGAGTITTQAYSDDACTAGKEIFDPIVSQL